MWVPLPPIDEQCEIVRQLEVLSETEADLTELLSTSEESITHLDQSILAKAFRGELVPQDPNDEPASVLLERIKAEREAAETEKKSKKKRKMQK
jgi:type I restriction enzyme S subunit